MVDDEQAIVDVLAYNLAKAGHTPLIARDGLEALRLAREESPDLVILDLMLPGIDGLDVCRELRRAGDATVRDVPVIMLTARDEEIDRVVGLEIGADDYVVKPFSVRELMARVKTVLRRTSTPPASAAASLAGATPFGRPERSETESKDAQTALRPSLAPSLIHAGDLRLDLERRTASWRGVPFELTAAQYDLLHVLAARPGRVFSRGAAQPGLGLRLLRRHPRGRLGGETPAGAAAGGCAGLRPGSHRARPGLQAERHVLNRLTPRLIFSHLLVIAVAMALLGFLLLSLVQSYFEQSVRDSLFLQARLVSRALTASPPLSPSNVSQALLPPASNAIQQQAQNRARPAHPPSGSTAQRFRSAPGSIRGSR